MCGEQCFHRYEKSHLDVDAPHFLGFRACPECRVTSDYICPSKYWIDTKEEKERLLSNYRMELQKKQCRYFDLGKGECPFGNKCFYRHEDAKVNGEAPATIIFLQKHILRQNATQLSILCRMPNSVGEGFVPDVMS